MGEIIMTDEKNLSIPASKISFYKETEDLTHGTDGKKTIISLNVESQTNEGALDLFKKLKEEMKS